MLRFFVCRFDWPGSVWMALIQYPLQTGTVHPAHIRILYLMKFRQIFLWNLENKKAFSLIVLPTNAQKSIQHSDTVMRIHLFFSNWIRIFFLLNRDFYFFYNYFPFLERIFQLNLIHPKNCITSNGVVNTVKSGTFSECLKLDCRLPSEWKKKTTILQTNKSEYMSLQRSGKQTAVLSSFRFFSKNMKLNKNIQSSNTYFLTFHFQIISSSYQNNAFWFIIGLYSTCIIYFPPSRKLQKMQMEPASWNDIIYLLF